ncbi:MAG: hypothetical protein HY459_01135 [Parcubacteria group bacterium]|nr:hypothetical protein [Parcubacteria group bacterium]
MPSSSRQNASLWGVIILLVLLILVGVFIVLRTTGVLEPISSGNRESSERWQAVFLSNGQVYFGRLSGYRTKNPILQEIYYLQISPALQSQDPNVAQGQQQQSNLTLVKLGNELHGPLDEMRINPEHILFVEDLKEDSRVVQAIQRYQSGNTGPTPSPAPTSGQ